MNFKSLFLFPLLLNFGCGVKSAPIPPQETMLPSIEAPFLKSIGPTKKATNQTEEKTKEEEKKKANKKAIK